jgi:RNA polymerase sigma factor (sigma-70 family)
MANDPGQGDSRRPRNRSDLPADIEALFERNLPHVRAFVRLRIDALTRDKEAISDVVQSACREVLANEDFEFRGELAFRSYLCQAALHKLQDRRRRYLAQKRNPHREQVRTEVDPAVHLVYRSTMFDPERRAIRAEEVAQLESAFDRLPDDYREALSLYRIVGAPIAEVAKHLGRTEAATKMLLSRAMARLTSLLSHPDP